MAAAEPGRESARGRSEVVLAFALKRQNHELQDYKLPLPVDASSQSAPAQVESAKSASAPSTLEQTQSVPSTKRTIAIYYLLGIVLGAATGYVNIRVEDLMLTAVMVTAFAMLVAFIRPDRPWRSALLVTALIPIGEVVAFKIAGQKLNRAGISEAILAFLPANAGAYGGAALRMVVRELWPRK